MANSDSSRGTIGSTTWTADSGGNNGFYSNYSNWFTGSNWSNGVPVESSDSLQGVVIPGSATPGPTIASILQGNTLPSSNYNVVDVYQAIPSYQGGTPTAFFEYQLDGQAITLAAGATLTEQGLALGRPGGTGSLGGVDGTISGLSPASSKTPVFDTLASIVAQGGDTVISNDVNHNFGFIGANGAGNDLNIAIEIGGNTQSPHGLVNYGEIDASNRGTVDIQVTSASGYTVNFYNEGWVLADGGTFIANSVADSPNAANPGHAPDGYIEISHGGEAVLGTVAAKEQVVFAGGTNNTLALTDAAGFAGSVDGFGTGQTIEIDGFSGTANVTTATVHGVTELETKNGKKTDIITLAGSIAPFFTARTISQGGKTTEIITAGADYTFTGGGTTTSWFNPSNWSGEVSPGETVYPGETVSIPTGTASIGGTMVTDNGTIGVTGSHTSFTDTTSLAGDGTIFIDHGTHVTLANSTGNDGSITVDFGTHGTTLAPNVLDINGSPAGFGGTIRGFGPNDRIVLGNSTEKTPGSAKDVSLSYDPKTGELTVTDIVAGHTYTESLHLTGTFDTDPANTLYDTVGPNGITISVPCFAEGTRILTASGEIAVEALEVGDLVVIGREGGVRTRGVVWIGHRHIALDRVKDRATVEPIRILAGAFGPGLPARDLTVSPDHAIFVDGALIEAKTLVNGATIQRDRAARRVTYYHVELDAHDVLLAEGLPAESYIDDDNRAMFANGAGAVALYPDFATGARAARCAELLTGGARVRDVRTRLHERAKTLGLQTTDTLAAKLLAGGDAIAALPGETGVLRFALPAGVTAASLAVATGVPAEVDPGSDDRRSLGLKIVSAKLIDAAGRQPVGLDSMDGLFAADDHRGRWSGARVALALPEGVGARVLEITYDAIACRWAPWAQQEAAFA